ncbi:hypothetical protein RAM19_05730 [Bartonella apihabitans]|nr:hypothetical protein [Bartonella apihabitans]WLT09630.1 hypothetical protein RAM19_05730 [Bartonella apihabitans]
MNILSFFFKRKIPEYKFFKTAFGYETFGLVAYQVYYNLYEDQFGNRKSKRFCAYELDAVIPKNTDFNVVAFSVTAQVDAWVAGGPVPSCLFDPLGSKKNNRTKTKNPRFDR